MLTALGLQISAAIDKFISLNAMILHRSSGGTSYHSDLPSWIDDNSALKAEI